MDKYAKGFHKDRLCCKRTLCFIYKTLWRLIKNFFYMRVDWMAFYVAQCNHHSMTTNSLRVVDEKRLNEKKIQEQEPC